MGIMAAYTVALALSWVTARAAASHGSSAALVTFVLTFAIAASVIAVLGRERR